jgi:hypothetical protein
LFLIICDKLFSKILEYSEVFFTFLTNRSVSYHISIINSELYGFFFFIGLQKIIQMYINAGHFWRAAGRLYSIYFYLNFICRYSVWTTQSLLINVCLMVLNATFNNISVTLWRSVLMVEETRENQWPAASHCWLTRCIVKYQQHDIYIWNSNKSKLNKVFRN